MLLPLHNHKKYCVRMSDRMAEISIRFFPALLDPLYILEGGRASGQVGGILDVYDSEPSVSLPPLILCLWLSDSWGVALEL